MAHLPNYFTSVSTEKRIDASFRPEEPEQNTAKQLVWSPRRKVTVQHRTVVIMSTPPKKKFTGMCTTTNGEEHMSVQFQYTAK